MPNLPNYTPEERRAMAQRARETRAVKKIAVDPAQLTFGIEIECYLPNTRIHDFRINIGAHNSGYNLPEVFPEGWTAEADGSLTDAPSGFTACEFVSPILKGVEGVEQVRTVLDFIGRPSAEGGLGARVTAKCGQHIHVGMPSVLGGRAREFEAVSEWVRRLLHLVAKHETALWAITGSMIRIDSYYCRSIKGDWKNRAGKHLSWGRLRSHSQHVDKYHSVNVKNLFSSKKTIEFRLFAATLNVKKTTANIYTALGLAHKAADNTAVADWNEDITPLVTDAGYYVAAVKHLQDRLAWLEAPSRAKYGWTQAAWDMWGKEVKENQIWNARHLAEQVAGR